MKKTVTFIILLALAAGTAGCGKPEPIRIGFAGNLTGVNSSVAISGRNGVMLAIEEVNRNGGIKGRPVELVIRDDEESPEKAAQADRELIAAGVPAIIGHFMSSVADASLEAVAGSEVILLSPTVSNAKLKGVDDAFLRLIRTNTEQGSTLGGYARQSGASSRTWLVLSEKNRAFSSGVGEGYRQVFEAQGGQVAGETYLDSQDLESMAAIIDEAAGAGCDSFLMVLNSGDVAMFAQQVAQKGGKQALYSATWGMTADVILRGGAAVEGIVFPALFDPNSRTPGYMAFEQRFREVYQEPVDFSAVYAYETAQVLLEGLRSAASITGPAVKEAIIAQGTFQGLQEPLQIDAYGDVKRPYFMAAVRDGAFVTLGKVD